LVLSKGAIYNGKAVETILEKCLGGSKLTIRPNSPECVHTAVVMDNIDKGACELFTTYNKTTYVGIEDLHGIEHSRGDDEEYFWKPDNGECYRSVHVWEV
jgi:hypothetical protein